MIKKPLAESGLIGTWVLHELSQAVEVQLLPTMPATNENVADLDRFSRVWCLLQVLDCCVSGGSREPRECQLLKYQRRCILLTSPAELLYLR